MALASGSRPHHHQCFGRGAISSAESIETVFGKHSLSRLTPSVGRVFHTAKSALRLWPLVGVTATALHFQVPAGLCYPHLDLVTPIWTSL